MPALDLLFELDEIDGSPQDINAEEASDAEEESSIPNKSDSERTGAGSDSEPDADGWDGFDEEEDGLDPANPQASEDAPVLADPEKQSSATRYIPPHLRQSAATEQGESEEIIKMTRQLKGQLNRMTEQNIGSIVDAIEEMYRKHRRHDITAALTKLIIDGIASHSILLDSYVVLHASFVSAMHKIVGIEFAAYFTQTVVSSYERYYREMLEQPTENDSETKGKECSNLIVLLSELYNFQVISCILIYDVIRDLLSKALTEWNVELLLKIARNSGPQLRQDDPSALKDIIQIVQSKISGQTNSLSSRTRFMLETLINLKNNKLKTNAAPGSAETAERLKKYLSGLSKKRHVLGHEPLRIFLKDLHAAESKGKWWLVGAAWNGNPLVDRLDNAPQEPRKERSDNVLLKLARKQGMNTDIRRSIFVVLMSSEDYLDACERLAQLNLTEVQQREIVRVVLHCCGKEKAYNPFYTLVCQQLCRTSHSYKITLQFCLWDFLRDLGETNVGGAEVIKGAQDDFGSSTGKAVSTGKMKNVAKAYAWWIAKECCSISILKPVDFTILKPKTRVFLRELFIQLFISSQASSPTDQIVTKDTPLARNRAAIEQIFIKATRIETLALGLLYFLGEAFRDDSEDGRVETVKWAVEVAKDTLRTGMDVIPNL
ncbi:ARM repeat-containing protein [Heliocybe sulcata]|uniref:ARM repeat-containing protein n=1 Tax=Heliocybe sulcata TaxID=5364 RepID=A0A5C3N1T4_9AGAM|nr:ARM repeat-containing protein [Heliocybe sulcata]